MSSDNNIIALVHEPNLNTTSTHTSTESIIQAVKCCASNHLEKLVSKLFENAKRILSSEKILSAVSSGKSRVQQNYIEEMQTFLLKKEPLKAFFNAELINHCDESIKPRQFRTQTTSLDAATDLLLSAQEEHLEESVTLCNLIAKGHKLYNNQLSTIEKRFGIIAPTNCINKNNIPFGPEHLCNAFKKSLHIQNPSSELILIVYSLFDDHVIQQLEDTYSEINSIMRDAGILPKLMSEPSTTPYVHFLGTTTHTKNTENNSGEILLPEKTDQKIEHTQRKQTKKRSAKSNNDLFGTLQHFAMMKRHMVSKSEINAGSTHSAVTYKQQSVLVESKTKSDLSIMELQKYLNEIQQDGPNNNALDKASIIENIIQKSYIQTQILSKKVKSVDETTIDLICMLFDSIKRDSSIPSNMKQAMVRLKLPIIKLALSDKDFFNQPDHAARTLLNQLASSSICWNEMNNINDDPLYKKVDSIIDRIINDVHNNIHIYNQLANELTDFLDAGFLDKSTVPKEHADRSPKESDDIACGEIEKHISNTEIPETVLNFLLTTWKNVLAHILSNVGESSLTWRYAVSITSKLVTSTQPKLTQKDKQNLLTEIPIIIDGLQDGLTLISYNRAKIQRFFNALELVHMASLKGELIDTYDLSCDEPPPGPSVNLSANQQSNEQTSALSPTLCATTCAELMIKQIEEVTSRLDNKKIILNNDESDAYLVTVKKLTVGSWIEFTEENNKKFRAKLAWKSITTGEFSFADRHGNVVTEKSLSDLVTDFRNGRIHIINDAPLIDRSFDYIRLQLENFVYKHNTHHTA